MIIRRWVIDYNAVHIKNTNHSGSSPLVPVIPLLSSIGPYPLCGSVVLLLSPRRLDPHVVEVLAHLHLHQLQQLRLAFLIQVEICTEVIHNEPYPLLVARVKNNLSHLIAHVDIDNQEWLIIVCLLETPKIGVGLC